MVIQPFYAIQWGRSQNVQQPGMMTHYWPENQSMDQRINVLTKAVVPPKVQHSFSSCNFSTRNEKVPVAHYCLWSQCGLKVWEGYLNHNNVGKRKQSDIMLFLSSHYSVYQGFGFSSVIWSAQLAILISHCKGCAFEADLCHGIQSFIYSRGVQHYSPWANWGPCIVW